MNQILVTKKLYITPELRRKKRIYKFDFILSIFLVIVLMSIYIYAEYDRNKSEEVSQNILEEFLDSNEKTEVAKKDKIKEDKSKEDSTVIKDDSVLLIVLDEDESDNDRDSDRDSDRDNDRDDNRDNDRDNDRDSDRDNDEEDENDEDNNERNSDNESNQSQGQTRTTVSNVKTTSEGYRYKSVATISIPTIGVNYAILEGEEGSTEETDALLKISPCKFWGPNVNEVGNYCIVGHNWRNTKFFSKVPTLEEGDTFTITEPNKRSVTYEIYDKYTVDPRNVSCTTQLTGGKKEVTLITCTDNSEKRVIIKAREQK